MYKITMPLLFLSLYAGFAHGQDVRRHILIYPLSNSISYGAEAGKGSCRMSVFETEHADVLEENAHFMKVRFPEGRMKGCFTETITGRDINVGWISKDDVAYADDDPTPGIVLKAKDAIKPSSAPCRDPIGDLINNSNDIRETTKAIRSAGMGLKDTGGIDHYMACYPVSSMATKNYATYSPIMDKITDSFAFRRNGTDYNVNPSLFRCLLIRESGFDPANVSNTGATGVGQHTWVNILSIRDRLAKKENWERQMWDKFFSDMRTDPQGKILLAQCPKTAGGAAPTFSDKQDAACPLNSLAASAIYNLQIQESLRRATKNQQISVPDELNYQVAVGAAYNLGDGAASKAVNNLVITDWPGAIENKAQTPNKKSEVHNHINALRNCMQKDNWSPMAHMDTKNNKCASTAPLSAK